MMQTELARLRLMHFNDTTEELLARLPQNPQMPGSLGPRQSVPAVPQQMQRHGARSNTSAIPAGSANLPPGVTIPEGWTLLPLQRLDGHAVTQSAIPANNTGLVPTATSSGITNTMPGVSNNTLHVNNPETQSASSTDSSDNAIHTPTSILADQSNAPFQQNLSIPSITPSTMPAQMPSSNPSQLPGWGSTQLFSAPGNTNNVASSSMDVGHSSSVSTDAPSSHDSEERRREKGKAKSATVEDTVDETEDS
jgi:E3 ubiquitin-protein ligase synoviolin